MGCVLFLLAWAAWGLTAGATVAVAVLSDRRARRFRPVVWMLPFTFFAVSLAAGSEVSVAEILGGSAFLTLIFAIIPEVREGSERHRVLVWMKRLLRLRGMPPGGFWEEVDDTPRGPNRSGAEGPTELISADTPAGRGTEPEASPAPAGRGTEPVSTADAETDADGSRQRDAMRYRG